MVRMIDKYIKTDPPDSYSQSLKCISYLSTKAKKVGFGHCRRDAWQRLFLAANGYI